MSDGAVFEVEQSLPNLEPATELLAAARASGKSLLAISRDMLRTIRRSRGKISMVDYLYYRLWDDAYANETKLSFVGRRLEPVLHTITADREWVGAFHDKLINYQVLEHAGFPTPETVALYRDGATTLGNVTCLATPECLAAFLRRPAITPCFGKPVTGIRSTGTIRMDGYDPATDQLILPGEKRVGVDEMVTALSRYSADGYLFQRVLQPHPDIARLTAGRLASARLIVLIPKAKPPYLHRALLKLPVGDNIADNFWRSGNLLAAVEIGSGRIRRVVSGVGCGIKEIGTHPDSGIALRDAPVPDWQKAVDVCLAASRLFPRIRMQAWDVALTTDGPVLLEANVGGDYNLPQIAHAEGMLGSEFRAFLADCIATRKIPSNKLLKHLM